MKHSPGLCKTKKLLVDGFNLIYKFPDLEEKMARRDLPAAMSGLITILRDYRKASGRNIRIVFDGKKREGDDLRMEKVSGMDVYYSQDYTADYLIMQFIKKDPQPTQTTVVTSDKEIVFFMNRFRTPVIKSEDFAAEVMAMLAPKEQSEPEKDAEVYLQGEELSFWEKMFTKGKNS